MKDSTKGYLLAFLSVLSVSNVYIFSKAALNEINLFQFGLLWFGFGLIWILIYAKYRDCYKKIKSLSSKNIIKLIQIGLFEVGGTYFFYMAIDTISDPSTTSFLGNISPIILIVFSFLFLKEKFSVLTIFGMILALLGAIIISTKGLFSFDFFIDGVQYLIFSSLIFGVNGVLIKKNIKDIPPIILTINRSAFMFLFSFFAFLYTNQTLNISNTAFWNTFIGSVLGPFLTVVTGYLSLKYILVSQKAIIGSTKGIFVVIGSYLYFGNLPNNSIITGGLMTIAGVFIISYYSFVIQKIKQKS